MSSDRSIPLPVRCMLWGRAAGRCEFTGCNKPVSFNSKTKEAVNLAQAAHIIGFSPEGPRGENDLSEPLSKDISNLMILCGECHKTIDTNKASYPVDLLKQMKTTHEQRIERVSGIAENKQSHILLYGANVGEHASPLTYTHAASAIMPGWYPAENAPIALGMVNSSFRDRDDEFWRIESTQLRNMVSQRLRPRLASGEIKHLSVFAFAPQPLAALLGFLLSDIPSAETYQLHREPPGWRWQENPPDFHYIVTEPADSSHAPALVLALSATITDDRITSVLKGGASVWRLTIPEPHNDYLKSRMQLRQFRQTIRPLLDRIKARHGHGAVLHVFPAVPLAVVVELGRVLMPKADLPLRIYDENRDLGGFVHALDIGTEIPCLEDAHE